MTMAAHIKENFELRGIAHNLINTNGYHFGGKHGGMQADMVLEE